MTKSGMNPKVDLYVGKAKKWREELEKLRMIMLDCQLIEELKWGKPCYTFQKSNIVIMLPLKEHCALLFCKGALLNDAQWSSNQTWGEYTGGAPDSVHQCSRNS
jgi:uncharacterized protein YdeI (YjbR/CyaY-like superfamily)